MVRARMDLKAAIEAYHFMFHHAYDFPASCPRGPLSSLLSVGSLQAIVCPLPHVDHGLRPLASQGQMMAELIVHPASRDRLSPSSHRKRGVTTDLSRSIDCSRGLTDCGPFLCNERFRYDMRGLIGFPKRCSFSFGDLNGPLSETKSSVFQSWVLFGTMMEIFSIYAIPVRYLDFLHVDNGQRYLTTKFLPDYIAAWITAAARDSKLCLANPGFHYWTKIGFATRSRLSKSRVKFKVKRVFDILRTAHDIVDCLGDNHGMIDTMMWAATLFVCSTLHNAAWYIYRSFDIPPIGPDRFGDISYKFVRDSTLLSSWCKHDSEVALRMFKGDLQTLLLCYFLDRRQASMTHSSCTITTCNALQVDNATYQTRHVVDGCRCEHVHAGNLYADVKEHTRMPGIAHPIPVVTYRDNCLKVRKISPIKSGLKRGTSRALRVSVGGYAAISHVWAHGRGNARGNSLPRCQLQKLQVRHCAIKWNFKSDRLFIGACQWLVPCLVPSSPVLVRYLVCTKGPSRPTKGHQAYGIRLQVC